MAPPRRREECIKMEYGLQLFSVRDVTERDMEVAQRPGDQGLAG